MSQLKLTADSGGGTVAIKGPASTAGNAAIELTVPGTGSGTLAVGDTGKVLQVVSFAKTDTSSLTMTTSYQDVSGYSLSITPTATNSKIILSGSIVLNSSDNYAYGQFVRSIGGGSYSVPTNWQGDASGSRTRNQFGALYRMGGHDAYDYVIQPMSIYAVDTDHNTTSAITYKLQFKTKDTSSRVIYFNRSEVNNDSSDRGVACSHLTLMEVAA